MAINMQPKPKIIQIIGVENNSSLQTSVMGLDNEGNVYCLYAHEKRWEMFVRNEDKRS